MMVKNCESLDVTGIKRIESLNQEQFILETILGMMTIQGKNLEMVNLNIESGELSVTGYVNSITYENAKTESSKKENILTKLFK